MGSFKLTKPDFKVEDSLLDQYIREASTGVAFIHDRYKEMMEKAEFKRYHREPTGGYKEEIKKIVEIYLKEDYDLYEFIYDVIQYGQKTNWDVEGSSVPV